MIKLSEIFPIVGISEVKYFHFIFREQIHAHSVMSVTLLTFIWFVKKKKK